MDHCALLGVRRDATGRELLDAFYERAAVEELGISADADGSDQALRRLQRAFATLSHWKARARYDRALANTEALRQRQEVARAAAAAAAAAEAEAAAADAEAEAAAAARGVLWRWLSAFRACMRGERPWFRRRSLARARTRRRQLRLIDSADRCPRRSVR